MLTVHITAEFVQTIENINRIFIAKLYKCIYTVHLSDCVRRWCNVP